MAANYLVMILLLPKTLYIDVVDSYNDKLKRNKMIMM